MTIEIKVPDIGAANQVDVIAVLVKVGDTIAIDTPLATLEGDKASMDIPSTEAGVVESVAIKVGDKVSEGSVICTISGAAMKPKEAKAQAPATVSSERATSLEIKQVEAPKREITNDISATSVVHASPAIRRLAHELDLDLSKIKGTGEKNRVTKD